MFKFDVLLNLIAMKTHAAINSKYFYRVPHIIRWVARIYGTVVLAIPLIALAQVIGGDRVFFTGWQNIVLHISLILGLSIAYKWELIGGSITLIGVFISGFIHPVVLPSGILYIVSWFLNRGKAKNNKRNDDVTTLKT